MEIENTVVRIQAEHTESGLVYVQDDEHYVMACTGLDGSRFFVNMETGKVMSHDVLSTRFFECENAMLRV